MAFLCIYFLKRAIMLLSNLYQRRVIIDFEIRTLPLELLQWGILRTLNKLNFDP